MTAVARCIPDAVRSAARSSAAAVLVDASQSEISRQCWVVALEQRVSLLPVAHPLPAAHSLVALPDEPPEQAKMRVMQAALLAQGL